MAIAPSDLGDDALAFLAERHLAVLTTLRPGGEPHAAPVGFGYDAEERVARVITFEGSRKVRNLDAAGEGRVAIEVAVERVLGGAGRRRA